MITILIIIIISAQRVIIYYRASLSAVWAKTECKAYSYKIKSNELTCLYTKKKFVFFYACSIADVDPLTCCKIPFCFYYCITAFISLRIQSKEVCVCSYNQTTILSYHHPKKKDLITYILLWTTMRTTKSSASAIEEEECKLLYNFFLHLSPFHLFL